MTDKPYKQIKISSEATSNASFSMTDKETLTAEQLAERILLNALPVKWPSNKGCYDEALEYIAAQVNQHTSDLQSQLADKDKEIAELKRYIDNLHEINGSYWLEEIQKEVIGPGFGVGNEQDVLNAVKALKEAYKRDACLVGDTSGWEAKAYELMHALEWAEQRVAGLVEVLEKADEFITQHLEAEEQASVAGINFAWRESAAQTIINVGQIVEQALTDAQPLVRERDKRIIQECIDDIEDMDRSSVMPEYWHKGVKDSIACLKNKQGGV